MKYIAVILLSSVILASCGTTKVEPTPSNTSEDNTPIVDNTTMEDEDIEVEQGVMVGGAMMVPNLNIVENALNSEDHTTLVAAVQAAGLVDALQAEGPFTVFAPTNEAFAALPAGTVDTLLLPENKDTLTAVLTYHVVPGKYTLADLIDGMTLTTLQGDILTVTYEDGVWKVNGANIQIADAVSTNGVTHIIDTVLTPAE